MASYPDDFRPGPTPSAIDRARSVPELKKFMHFTTWRAITEHLDMETGDSACGNWVKINKPAWPCYVPRHRGKSPHQAAYLMRSLRIQQETAVLASLFALSGLVPAEPSAAAGAALPDIIRGDSLCTAFETYTTMVPTASISFEYAVFLAGCLARGDQLRLGRCSDCGGVIVVERFPIREKRCQHCTAAAQRG